MGGVVPVTPELHAYIVEHSMPLDEVARDLVEETNRLGDIAGMLTEPDQAAVLTILTRLIGARRAIEIGTFTGFSALAITRGMPEDGSLLCLDSSEEWTSIGRKYWERAGVADRIELRLGDGHATLAGLPAEPTYDLAFVDADKVGYIDYYEQLLPRVRANGVLLFDNTLAGGRVIGNEPAEDRLAFNAHVAADDRVDVVLLGISDGLTLIRKR